MIRQFGQRWKCGKGSSPFAKFAHRGVLDRFDRDTTGIAPQGVCFAWQNRCDLVTNGRKVGWRHAPRRQEMTALAI
jgi:hypothetical protein